MEKINKKLETLIPMASLIRRFIILLFVFLSISSISSHPFDPFSPLEIQKVTTIIKSKSNLKNLNFHYLGIHEPSKPAVLSWLAKPRSRPPPREAFAVVRADGKTHEFVVGLDSGTILSARVYDSTGFPTLSIKEQEEAIELSLKHAPLVAAIERRGLNVSKIVGSVFTIGWFGQAARETKRVVKVLYFNGEDSVNVWVRPVEGIETVVDLDIMAVVEFKDLRVCVMPKSDGTDYRGSAMRPPYVAETNPIKIQQPKGPSFVIRGHTLRFNSFQ